jgi:hypothetical protein
MVSDPKQVRTTMDELVRAFYTSEKTKPSASSSVFGPYSLIPGDDLIIETENGFTSVSIVAGQVSDFNNVSASEIAAIINSSQSNFLADALTDRSTGLKYLRITSVTSGVNAFVRISGGKLQNVLKFPAYIATANSTGTTWNLTKSSAYTDEIMFTWDGIGTNPNVYLSKKNDVVTIRGFEDGLYPFSELNGSYTIVDCGYDYFVIRNAKYQALASAVTQNLDTNIVFTQNKKLSLYDQAEYAITSEIDHNTLTVTVPAVPPLTKRFLEGSWHLRGYETDIIDFTRSSVQLNLAVGVPIPAAENMFFIRNSRLNPDAKAKKYKTISVNANPTQPTYVIDTNSEKSAVFPYTTDTLIGSNPIYGTLDSDLYTITFPYRHGLLYGWGATLSGATGVANVLSSDLNKEHEIQHVVNEYTARIRLKDSSGAAIKFAGVSWGPADIYQYTSTQSDGSDFYIQWPSPSQAIASGLVPGTLFKLDALGGTDVSPYLAGLLKSRYLNVTSVSGSVVSFSSGIGSGSAGLIISAATGKRSGAFGGSVSYRLDKTSSLNQDRVFQRLQSIMIAHTPEINSAYLGSYLYDPSGVKSSLTVSKFIVHLTDNVLKGDNLSFLIVDSATVNGENFPQSGEIVLDYGTSRSEGPIRYFAVVSNPGANQILIDPSYKFKKSHPVGAQVQYIRATQPHVPNIDGSDLQPYITGTSSARNTLFSLIELLVAAGVFVERDVILPELRYDDVAINPFE